MRKLIFSVLFLFALGVSAQDLVKVKRGFDVETGVKLDSTFTIGGKSYELFKTKKGSKYVKLLSPRTGNYYALWVGKLTDLTHDGEKVYQMKSGRYCIYKVSAKTGNPYPLYLQKKE